MPTKKKSATSANKRRKNAKSGGTAKGRISESVSSSEILKTARKSFGFETLRPGQESAITSLLKSQDCLVVMPTGSGKSAIYQIAALLQEGPTLIVSPLIALQKDQMDSINSQSRTGSGDEAVLINSTQHANEAREAVSKIEEGNGKFIFLAPEQLRKDETIRMLEEARISLFVVDEAHCISEWGHDFRPDYLQLGAVIERLDHPTVLAMTATASRRVREEIISRLGMRSPKVLVYGFDRPNIYLRVDHFEHEDEKMDALIRRVNFAGKPGIVYVATRKTAEQIMSTLQDSGVGSLFYHGGLKASERHAIQEQFMAGRAEVIVATNAFGMGIDKTDIRFVYHYDICDSIDSYYQEIGRAGRDGEKAEAVLFFRAQDVGVQKFLSGEGKIDAAQIERLANVIADQEGPVETEEIAGQANLSERKMTWAIHLLEDVGAVEILPTGAVKANSEIDTTEAARTAAEAHELQRQMRRDRLMQMQEYADASACRREIILQYFGDNFKGPCGNCDNCETSAEGIKGDFEAGTRREVA